MNLEQRLRRLQGGLAPMPDPERPSLRDRLRRLGARPGAAHPTRPADLHALAERLGAATLAPGVLCVERCVPLPHAWGAVVLERPSGALPSWLHQPSCSPGDWLFLDTETSGLAGGTGTWVFLLGLLRVGERELRLRQYLLARLDAEPAYLDALEPEIRDAGLLLTYNGKSFDVPLMATRFRLAGLRAELDGRPHLDLLHPVRRAFGRLWPDCRLVSAERRLLRLVRDSDLPGAEAPAAWLAWLRQGEVDPLTRVLDHNRCDLLSLPALLSILEQAFREPGSLGADVRAVAAYHRARGDLGRARDILSTHREVLCTAGKLDLARLERAMGNWPAALGIWEQLAALGDPDAMAALAKYLEHRRRDLRAALAIAERLPPGPERERRCLRLCRRLGNKGG